ncbi:hypothetical protein GWK08_08455 [Leptobacterium flavescens]|uniref:Uncharacterized protein n=1 Tax=Leptobacterium flavescens TaxID=472055 RepID=A0A6P0UJS0_9FLAO|nr:hypothetical protein [Leptobacterium flavescens]NER13464.1 hypothetical protein [Leptobacterium flavescens]
MKRLIEWYWKIRSSGETLADIDEFYGTIVSKMPCDQKIDYCRSLVYRTEDDLRYCECKLQRIKLKQLLRASTLELKYLKMAAA